MSIFAPDATLDELLAAASAKFNVVFEPVVVDGKRLDILQIADMSAYLDQLASNTQQAPLVLPFWAKIWPACTLLSFFAKRLPKPESKSLLEIGAGVGLAGLFAAAAGFDVTISDISEDALLFCRVNILKNGLADRARVRKVDFTADKLDQTFDYILGCEVLYHEESYRPLVKFLLRHLKYAPEAEAILSVDCSRGAKKFFDLAEKEFLMQRKVVSYGDKDSAERSNCAICRMRPRKRP
jgi:2-polyprenyl-3-methyl-5-hydroxy-6-metoxy-1,4-benzoquinol methylase